ncbi:MAG: death-on-curing protein, partial [Thermoplasmata archaeon]
MTNLPEPPNNSGMILYQTEDGQTCIQVNLQGETVW